RTGAERARPPLRLRRPRFLSSLALRTPVGHTRAEALRPGADRSAAARAGPSLPTVDLRLSPHPVEAARHQGVRCFEHATQVIVSDGAERSPRRDARPPQRLGLPQVPDTGDEALIEERVPDRAVLLLAPQTCEHRLEVGRFGEDVGTESPRDTVVELEHGTVEHRADVLTTAQDEPGRAEDGRLPGEDAPASLHAEMAAQNEPSLDV